MDISARRPPQLVTPTFYSSESKKGESYIQDMSAPRRSYMIFVAKYCFIISGNASDLELQDQDILSQFRIYIFVSQSDMEDIWLDLKLDFVASYLERNFIAFGPELVLPVNIF